MTEKTKKTSSIKQILTEEFAGLLSVTEPDIIFSEAVRIIAETFDCAACYIMTICDESILELQSIFDLGKITSFQDSSCTVDDIPEGKAIANRDTVFTNKWINNSELVNFISIKNANISMIAEPLIYDGDVIGTISLFFKDLNKWPKRTSENLKFACKYVSMLVKKALEIKLIENELKIKRLLDAISNFPYEDKEKTLRSIARMIMQELRAANCMIISKDNVYCAEQDGVCIKRKTTNCNSIEFSPNGKVTPPAFCPNYAKDSSYDAVYYCVPLETGNGDYGTLSLKFYEKKAPKTSDDFVIQDVAAALSRFLHNFYAVSKYKELISINANYMKRLQKYAEDLEFANSSMQYVSKHISASSEFSKIFSSSADLEQAIISVLHKLSLILINKPSFIMSAVFEDISDTGNVIILENIDDVKKIRRLKVNFKPENQVGFLKRLEDSKKNTVLDNEDMTWLNNSLELWHNSQKGYAWPVLLPNRQMLAVLIAGFKNNVAMSPEDERILNSLSYKMALPIRNGLLNRSNVIEKNKLKAIINSIADGVITVNLQQKITACNTSAQEIFGLSEQEMMRSYYYELTGCSFTPPDSPDVCYSIWKGLAEADKGYFKQEFQRMGEDGKPSFFESAISPITYDCKDIGAVIVLRDITEKKYWEQDKNDFIAVIAHDLRTPLTAVKNYISILMDHGLKLKAEQTKEFYTVINSEMDRFTRLLGDFTSLGRMDLGKLKSSPKKFNISDLINKVTHLHGINTKKHNIELTVTDNLFVYADKDQIEQVLNNLLSNAIKYSPDGGNVKVSTTKGIKENTVRISIEDSGIGLTPEAQATLFNRYTRVKTEATKYIQGTGLGLYICKILVESNGGNIGIKSTMGEGSTFYIEIPLPEDQDNS